MSLETFSSVYWNFTRGIVNEIKNKQKMENGNKEKSK